MRGHVKAPDQVSVFPAGVQAQCHQSSLPTRGLGLGSGQAASGRRAQRPGWSRPTFPSSVLGGRGPRVGGVPKLSVGGWGPALGHLPGAFRAECR